ncbi:phosphatase [Clostridiisalibacter paucivorans]|uniref:phosphatase n=1 Tax=Clostridiisalibacter paucivorans TaxID=408753 RepID=UPI00047EB29B|nr:phosphatase [Clostridiisalibacter paucivorans]
MMYLMDIHCHTIASGHAYSTVSEVIHEASNKGLSIVALTDHGPEMPGGPHMFYIANQRVIPKKVMGVHVLKGVEANIMDFEGALDVPDRVLKNLDLVIASLHDKCIEPGHRDENTAAIIGAIENPLVDIIGHSGNPVFPIHKEEMVLAAKKNNTLIEINNSSLGVTRKGSLVNCIEIAKLCKKYKVPVVMGSDAHIAYDVGNFDKVVEIFKDIDMPRDLIMNLWPEKFMKYLENKGKKRFESNI